MDGKEERKSKQHRASRAGRGHDKKAIQRKRFIKEIDQKRQEKERAGNRRKKPKAFGAQSAVKRNKASIAELVIDEEFELAATLEPRCSAREESLMVKEADDQSSPDSEDSDYATPPSSPDRDAQISSSEKTFDDTQTQESQLSRYELMEKAAEDSLQMKTPENSPKANPRKAITPEIPLPSIEESQSFQAKPILPEDAALGNETQEDRPVQDTFQQPATNQRRRVSEFLFPPARNPSKRKRSKSPDKSSEKKNKSYCCETSCSEAYCGHHSTSATRKRGFK